MRVFARVLSVMPINVRFAVDHVDNVFPAA
jgi:hypothetical protein